MKIERVVIDASVFISAIFNRRGQPAQIVERTLRDYTPVFSVDSLEELRTRLQRPKFDRAMPLKLREKMFEAVYEASDIVRITGASMGCRDRQDDKILETALIGEADCLITNDKDLTSLRLVGESQKAECWEQAMWRGIPIVYPGEFLCLLA